MERPLHIVLSRMRISLGASLPCERLWIAAYVLAWALTSQGATVLISWGPCGGPLACPAYQKALGWNGPGVRRPHPRIRWPKLSSIQKASVWTGRRLCISERGAVPWPLAWAVAFSRLARHLMLSRVSTVSPPSRFVGYTLIPARIQYAF